MDFTAFKFWGILLPCIFLLYCIVPQKMKNTLLLLASFLFYACFSVKHTVYLLFSVAVTYIGGMLGDGFLKKGYVQKGKAVLILAFCLNLLSLLVFKYTNFAIKNLNYLLEPLGLGLAAYSIVLPIGLSFFVFQSSTYLFDILNGKISAESNLADYALFVSFFPTITSGPIQRSTDFLPQIKQKRVVSWERFQKFFITFLWGAFLKVVVANRIAVFTDVIFRDYQNYGFFMLALAALSYSIQIYADFSGYSYMAIAVATLFGFDLKENFMRPYAATSIADFWRRWHISLSSWFRDYLYIPLGGNRKGTLAKYRNLAIVFLISGLWHGASWNFILWGGIHAVYQIVGAYTKPWRVMACEKMGINRACFSYRLWQRIFVFLAATFAWVFFRIESCASIFNFFYTMLRNWDIHSLFIGLPAELGLDGITAMSILSLLTVSVVQERGVNARTFLSQNLPLRWACYFLLILSILLFGAYGPSFSASAFIYAGF